MLSKFSQKLSYDVRSWVLYTLMEIFWATAVVLCSPSLVVSVFMILWGLFNDGDILSKLAALNKPKLTFKNYLRTFKSRFLSAAALSFAASLPPISLTIEVLFAVPLLTLVLYLTRLQFIRKDVFSVGTLLTATASCACVLVFVLLHASVYTLMMSCISGVCLTGLQWMRMSHCYTLNSVARMAYGHDSSEHTAHHKAVQDWLASIHPTMIQYFTPTKQDVADFYEQVIVCHSDLGLTLNQTTRLIDYLKANYQNDAGLDEWSTEQVLAVTWLGCREMDYNNAVHDQQPARQAPYVAPDYALKLGLSEDALIRFDREHEARREHVSKHDYRANCQGSKFSVLVKELQRVSGFIDGKEECRFGRLCVLQLLYPELAARANKPDVFLPMPHYLTHKLPIGHLSQLVFKVVDDMLSVYRTSANNNGGEAAVTKVLAAHFQDDGILLMEKSEKEQVVNIAKQEGAPQALHAIGLFAVKKLCARYHHDKNDAQDAKNITALKQETHNLIETCLQFCSYSKNCAKV